jgi:hypothetical protein
VHHISEHLKPYSRVQNLKDISDAEQQNKYCFIVLLKVIYRKNYSFLTPEDKVVLYIWNKIHDFADHQCLKFFDTLIDCKYNFAEALHQDSNT